MYVAALVGWINKIAAALWSWATLIISDSGRTFLLSPRGGPAETTFSLKQIKHLGFCLVRKKRTVESKSDHSNWCNCFKCSWPGQTKFGWVNTWSRCNDGGPTQLGRITPLNVHNFQIIPFSNAGLCYLITVFFGNNSINDNFHKYLSLNY